MRRNLTRRVGLAAMALATVAPAALAQSAVAPEPRDAQPAWTARPPFGETGVYVLPKGVATFAFTLRPTTSRDGSSVTENAYRAAFGLPGRFHLGLHATGRAVDAHDVIGNIDAQTVEVRWGLAGWERAWGNPALHAEWREASRGADVATLKLLLGGGRARGWRWGTNVAWEQEAGGAREAARAWTAGASYESGRFASLGIETRLALVDRLGEDGRTRTAMRRELLAGPSIQIRPARRLFIDFSPLFGASASSPRSRTTVVAGWQF